jgi:DNA (cytosine-5)-methyltransferase 1
MSENDVIELCAGYGGLFMGLAAVTGARLAAYAEIDPGASAVMAHHHPGVPNLGDVKEIDWTRRRFDAPRWLIGGYPCQPFSAAGLRRGTADPRHLWPWFVPAIDALRPDFVLFENVQGHVKRGLLEVCGDLAALGYGGAWTVNRASDVGAPHQRTRVFILASRHAAPGLHEVNSFGVPSLANPYRLLPTPQARDGKGKPSHGGFNVSNLPRTAREELRGGFGDYAPAVAHWERLTARAAPAPLVPDSRGAVRLNPAFSEWMMGLAPGHVTAVPGLGVHALHRVVGNGVAWMQAAHAVRVLMRTVSQLPRQLEALS